MRHRTEGRRPWPAHPRALARIVVLVATIAIGTADSSNESGAAPAPPVSGRSSVAPPPATVPPAAAAASPMARSTPVRVRIPAIGVDSDLMDLGLQDDGTIEVPPDGFPAGWYTGAPTAGELGPAIIAGHVDWGGDRGVFYDLRNLKPDDEVTVARHDGSVAVFRVTRVEQFPKDEFPTAAVYGDIDHAGLRLITCGGSFNREVNHYEDNVVAFAQLVRARTS